MRLQDGLLYLILYGPAFGESIVLRDPVGTWVVVDGCLADGKSSAAALLAQHDVPWSGVALTHPHLDHALGFDAVLDHRGCGPIGCAVPKLRDPQAWQTSQDPERHLREGTLEHVLSVVHDRWTSDPACRWEMTRGTARQIGQLELTVLHPSQDLVTNPPDDPNRLSTALLVKWNDVRLLLGSDVVSVDWSDIANLFVGLDEHAALKFPHHGSQNAVHASWGEGHSERLWMMTPYSRGGKLPRYEDGHGLAWALQHVEQVHLTGLPVKHALQGQVPYRTTRQALLRGQDPPPEFQRIGALRFELLAESAGTADICFIAAGFDDSGALVDLQHGPGAVVVREDAVHRGEEARSGR